MKEKHHTRIFSVNTDGRLCMDNQVVESYMILFEEVAKSLLEQELMEGRQLTIPDYEEFILDFDNFFNGGNYRFSDKNSSFLDGISNINFDDIDINY